MPAAPSHHGLEIQQLGFLRDSRLESQLSHVDVLQVESLVHTGSEVADDWKQPGPPGQRQHKSKHTSLEESNGETLALLSQAPMVKGRTLSCQSWLQRNLGSSDLVSWKNP